MDQFHDQHGLAYARAAEQADLAALCVGADQVDDLDARLQDLRRRRLFLIGRRRTMNRPAFLHLGDRLVVHRLAQQVEHAAKAFLTYRHRYGAAGIHSLLASDQAVRGVHGDAAHDIVSDMLRHLSDHALTVIIDLNGV